MKIFFISFISILIFVGCSTKKPLKESDYRNYYACKDKNDGLYKLLSVPKKSKKEVEEELRYFCKENNLIYESCYTSDEK
jgi:hypothetical protein